jgi:hypothetical protein
VLKFETITVEQVFVVSMKYSLFQIKKKIIIDYKTVEGLLSHVYPDLGSVLASPHKCQNQLS